MNIAGDIVSGASAVVLVRKARGCSRQTTCKLKIGMYERRRCQMFKPHRAHPGRRSTDRLPARLETFARAWVSLSFSALDGFCRELIDSYHMLQGMAYIQLDNLNDAMINGLLPATKRNLNRGSSARSTPFLQQLAAELEQRSMTVI